MKRIAAVADLHCGSEMGLTPPAWQEKGVQIKTWKWFKERVSEIGPVDAVILNGDGIDGDGKKSKGVELITTDRMKQAEMLAQCLNEFDTERYFMTAGTAYHTGQGEDFEFAASKFLQAYKPCVVDFDDTMVLEIDGVVFDFRHFIGNSSIPHGIATPLLKEKVWNELNAARGRAHKADVLVRSHVHRYLEVKGGDNVRAITTPCMQVNSRFGKRICSGTTDYGFLLFEIEKGEARCQEILLDLRDEKPRKRIL